LLPPLEIKEGSMKSSIDRGAGDLGALCTANAPQATTTRQARLCATAGRFSALEP